MEQIVSVSTFTIRIVNVHLLAGFIVLNIVKRSILGVPESSEQASSQRCNWFAQNPEQKTRDIWAFYVRIAFKKLPILSEVFKKIVSPHSFKLSFFDEFLNFSIFFFTILAIWVSLRVVTTKCYGTHTERLQLISDITSAG